MHNQAKIPQNDLFLRAARREQTDRAPVWLMRQAGRTDPAYVQLRERCGLALHDLFRHPDLATEISLLPKRLGVDAIIMFQDILTPLSPMGVHFEFRPGPILDCPIRESAQIKALAPFDPALELGFVGQTLSQLKNHAGGELPILGFAGAPLTLAFFMIEGRSPGSSPTAARTIMHQQPKLFHQLLEKLAVMTVRYLDYQIQSGANAVQLFESMADVLTPEEYLQFAHPYHVQIFSELRRDVPRILFAKEQPDVGLMVQSGAEVISIGRCVDLATAKQQYGDRVALQGNVDNQLLRKGPLDRIEQATLDCIAAGGQAGHILNLNHGLLSETPLEHVQHFINVCKQTQLFFRS